MTISYRGYFYCDSNMSSRSRTVCYNETTIKRKENRYEADMIISNATSQRRDHYPLYAIIRSQ